MSGVLQKYSRQIATTLHPLAKRQIWPYLPPVVLPFLPVWMQESIPLNWQGSAKETLMSFGMRGRASDDAIRSLVISYKLLGTREFFVVHHTNCGMEFFTNQVIRELLEHSLETVKLTDAGLKTSVPGLVPGRANISNG
jgi:hypothetical protein